MTTAASLARNLQDEVTCSICLDYFRDPVMILDCGHNFCRACITEYQKVSNVSCPECRMQVSWQSLKPNRHLGNIVEVAKQLCLQLNSPRERMCTEHNMVLNLFCQTDRILICAACVRIGDHQGHSIVSAKIVAAEYKMKLQRELEHLKKEKNKIQTTKSTGEKPSQELLNETQAKRQEIVSEFQQEAQFLKEQEQFQLAKLGDVEREIKKTMYDYGNIFDDEIVYINNLIGEIERKRDQPDYQFLEDVGNIFDRCEERKFRFPDTPDLSEAKKKLNKFSQESKALQSTLRTVRDRKRARWGDILQTLPYRPKRAGFVCCVLARCVAGVVAFSWGVILAHWMER